MNRIAIISQHFYPNHSSTAQLITDLALGLANDGDAVQVFTSNDNCSIHSEPISSDVAIEYSWSPVSQTHSILSKGFASIFFLLSGLWYLLLRVSADVPLIIVSNPPYSGLLGLFFKLFKRGKYVFLFQDIFPESAVLSGVLASNKIGHRFFEWLMGLVCKQADKIVVLTPDMQAHLEKKYEIPQNSERLQVIENWSIEAIEPFPKSSNSFAVQHGLSEVFTVLYSGNIGRLHDIETIAEAILLMRDEPIRFIFIGDGPKRKILSDYLKEYHLSNLSLLPFQPRHRLHETLTACDVSLVSLIPGAEGIVAPCKFYGMLAAGRAIVSISATGSYLARITSQNDCGINCPPKEPLVLAQAIRRLATQPELLDRLANNAHQLYVEQYQLNRALREYKSLLLSLK